MRSGDAALARSSEPWLFASQGFADPSSEIGIRLPAGEAPGERRFEIVLTTEAGSAGPRPLRVGMQRHFVTASEFAWPILPRPADSLRPAFCVDVRDGSGRACAAVELTVTCDEPFVLRREAGLFEPAPPALSATFRSDASGRVVGYAERVPRSIGVAWTVRTADGSIRRGAHHQSGTGLNCVALEVP